MSRKKSPQSTQRTGPIISPRQKTRSRAKMKMKLHDSKNKLNSKKELEKRKKDDVSHREKSKKNILKLISQQESQIESIMRNRQLDLPQWRSVNSGIPKVKNKMMESENYGIPQIKKQNKKPESAKNLKTKDLKKNKILGKVESGKIGDSENQMEIIHPIESRPDEFLVLHGLIGKGSFGEVFLVQNLICKSMYAMKVLNKEVIRKHEMLRYALSEKEILANLDHPFIVKLRFAFQNSQSLYLLMDYVPCGNLSELIEKSKNTFKSLCIYKIKK